MQLITDIGNSDIVFGIYDESKWQLVWRITSKGNRSQEELKNEILRTLAANNIDILSIKKVTLSSVVPKLTPVITNLLKSLFQHKVLVINPSIYHKLNVKITTNINEIGTDLIANAVAGFHLSKSACIIVDFGTALTFTSVDSKGFIQGVAIAPGIKTAMKSLASNAAQLPEIPLELPQSAIGKDTIHAIQSGILYGYIGLVRGILEQTKKELGTCKVIATGGLSHILTSLSYEFDTVDKMLTMNGLRLISEMI